MKTNISSLNWSALGSSALGMVALLLVFAFLAGRKVPLIVNDRSAFIALAVIGFVMCATGMGRIGNGLGWTHPITVAGMVLGTLLILLVIAMLSDWRVPFIADYRTAFIAVAIIGPVKWVLAWVSYLLMKS